MKNTGLFFSHADCANCPIDEVCNGQQMCGIGRQGRNPDTGIMIVLPPPSRQEMSTKIQVGRDWGIVKALFESVHIDPMHCSVTYATLGNPRLTTVEPAAKKGSLLKLYPEVVASCRPRLLAEIEAYRPKVIITFGDALDALAMETKEITKRIAFDCPECDDDRKVGPLFACNAPGCDWHVWPAEDIDPSNEEHLHQWSSYLREQHEGKCPKCSANINRLRAKRVKCPACGGLKTRPETFYKRKTPYVLSGRETVAGAKMPASEFGLDAYGVRYVVPTYAPLLMGIPSDKLKGGAFGGQYMARACAEHIRRAADLVTQDSTYQVEVEDTEGLTDEEAAWVLRDYMSRRQPHDRLTFDVETDSYDGVWAIRKITCFGIHLMSQPYTLTLDTRHLVGPCEGNPLMEAIVEVMQDETLDKVALNRLYDEVAMLRIWDLEVLGEIHDVMLSHYACYPDEPHGLGHIAHELTDAPAWKGDSHKIAKGEYDDLSGYSDFAALALYNGRDNYSTTQADIVLRGPADGKRGGRLDEEKVRQVYEEDMRSLEVARMMQINGMPCDQEALDALASTADKHINMHLEAMRNMLGLPNFVPRGKELTWALFASDSPVAIPGNPKGSTAKEHLIPYADKPFVDHLLQWRKHDYAKSHYITSPYLIPHPSDGRWHPVWKPWGARTGRWTCDPSFMNWPKYLRSACRTRKGRKIVGADYDQLELRLIGYVADDNNMIQRVLNADGSDKLDPAKDPHSYVASIAFGDVFLRLNPRDPTHFDVQAGDALCACEKCARKALREAAKTVIYAINYGSGADTVHKGIYDKGYDGPPITLDMVKATMRTIDTEFPGIPRSRNETLDRARREGEIRSPILGRHRIFPMGDVVATVAANYPIQSGGADVMNPATYRLHLRLEREFNDAFLIAQVHDALYVECDEDDAEAVGELMTECMYTELVTDSGITIPLTAEPAIADSWDKAA